MNAARKTKATIIPVTVESIESLIFLDDLTISDRGTVTINEYVADSYVTVE